MEPGGVQVGFGEALRVWLKIGCLGFGGPAGQIALMHRILVDEKKWVEEQRYLHALNFCMLLPGPEAQKLATYVGWLLHGVRGGLAAGILFVLPGALVMLGVSFLYVLGAGIPAVDGALFGIKAAVLVIVVEALVRIARRALKSGLLYALAALAFVGIFFLGLPFPLIVAAAAAIGYLTSRQSPAGSVEAAPGSWGACGRALAIGLALWLAPAALVVAALGPDHVFADIAAFFSKLALVSFGGAYALLAYMAQEAVEGYRWMAAAEMVDGLGLAETLPGPLIKVTQFVGFLAAWRDPGPFSAPVAGLLGAALTTWVTFVFPMTLIFAGAPFIESLRANQRLSGALTAVTAAVVGVILNLTVWFSMHVLVGWKAVALAAVAAGLMFGLRRGLAETVAVMALLGMLVQFTL